MRLIPTITSPALRPAAAAGDFGITSPTRREASEGMPIM
jgi:hypothetical protein